MSRLFFSMLFLTVFAFAAQAGNPGDETVVKVKANQSTVLWTARKVTGQHNGSINIKDGSLTLKKGKLTGGTFTIDMPSISVLDLQDKGKASLEGHLKSDDFFGVDAHPTATLVVKDVKSKGDGLYDVTGDFTIKGFTNTITFPAQVTVNGKEVTATANLKIDRSQYNVKYGSGKFFENLGDKTINDEFDLNVKLVAAE